MPSRKIGAAAIAGALSGILVWALKAFGGQEIPGEVGSYLTTLLSFVVGYLVPEES